MVDDLLMSSPRDSVVLVFVAEVVEIESFGVVDIVVVPLVAVGVATDAIVGTASPGVVRLDVVVGAVFV